MQSLYTITQNNSNSYLNSTTNNKYVLSTDVGFFADAVQVLLKTDVTCIKCRFSNFLQTFNTNCKTSIVPPEFCVCTNRKLTFPSLSIGIFIRISFLYAIRSGHFFPNPNGGSICRSMLNTSV